LRRRLLGGSLHSGDLEAKEAGRLLSGPRHGGVPDPENAAGLRRLAARCRGGAFEQRTACPSDSPSPPEIFYGSPGLNGASLPGGVDSSAIASSMATET
jgi:hypothetical protein